MTPIKMFEGWLDITSWGLGIGIAFYWEHVWIQVGPFNAKFYWDGEPNWKV